MDTIGIIGAMEEEVELLKKALGQVDTYSRGDSTFYLGERAGSRIVLLRSGIGKVAAAVGTTLLISQFDPLCVINTGTAGALRDNFEVGDVIISTQVIHHDVDVTAFGYAPGQVPRMPGAFLPHSHLIKLAQRVAGEQEGVTVHLGSVATGDSFLNDSAKIDRIRERFPAAAAAEMEAAAIAQTCHMFRKPFIVIRSLSDRADGQAQVSFDAFLQKAADNSARMVLSMIDLLRHYVDRVEGERMASLL